VDGQQHAFLLNPVEAPVPEPASAALLASALLLCAILKTRRL
jgi:hypothetical protein